MNAARRHSAVALVLGWCCLAAAQDAPATQPADPWEVVTPALTSEHRELARRGSAQTVSTRSAGAAARDSWWRSLGALALVVALIVLLAWGYRVTLGGGVNPTARGRRAGMIEVLSRASLGPKHTLFLVRVGPRTVLLGAGSEGLRALDVIADPALTADLAGAAAVQQRAGEALTFQAQVEREAQAYAQSRDAGGADAAGTLQARIAQRLAQIVGKTG